MTTTEAIPMEPMIVTLNAPFAWHVSSPLGDLPVVHSHDIADGVLRRMRDGKGIGGIKSARYSALVAASRYVVVRNSERDKRLPAKHPKYDGVWEIRNFTQFQLGECEYSFELVRKVCEVKVTAPKRSA
jgi:hypothetical protein